MSTASAHPAEPSAPPGAAAPVRATGPRRLAVVLLLVLAMLLGTAAAAGAGLPAAEPRAAASGTPDTGGETYDVAETVAAATVRARRRRAVVRTGERGPGRRPRNWRPVPAPTPVPLPRGDARRCVVMRC
ncbi:hypothetical protein [Streptomyces vilmorinianum]|uniref:hypothetical protein n=1 Tax=Streptomyces vilmorinianum TaxID=3051092 RepID=UPI0010FB58E6|nr:hypothetical protein [Streptomyces vilmorinianum]